jgi:NCS2 family nucleobase:cation symporter-2/xanthine permease XanP
LSPYFELTLCTASPLAAKSQRVGLPEGGWPGFDLGFGPVFLTLLPAFMFVTLVGAIETIGDAIAIQRVS